MGKYEALTKDVLAIFGSSEWLTENINTYPGNFTGNAPGNTYIRVHVIPGSAGLNLKSVAGQVVVDIFTPVGEGPLKAIRIADRLDAYLVGESKETLIGVVQFSGSSFSPVGVDKGNAALYRSTYVVPFKFFGVL